MSKRLGNMINPDDVIREFAQMWQCMYMDVHGSIQKPNRCVGLKSIKGVKILGKFNKLKRRHWL